MQTVDLRRIEEGMKVVDRSGHEIGTVEWVRFGADDPSTPELEAAAPDTMPERDRGLMDVIADAFRADELPQEIQERLLQQGFVRIDANGLFAHDRYVLPDQILSISADELTLNADKDDLLKRPN